MSTAKYQQLYKVFEPSYHAQRPIIVDDGIESPETVTLRYEEQAARANGGQLRSPSPPDILPMAAYKTQPAQLHSFDASSYTPYSPQSYQPPPADAAASQLNSLAYPASNPTAPYMNPATPTSPVSPVNIISCSPAVGPAGTRVELKVTSQYDLMAMSPQAPYVCVSFGAQRCHAEVVKEAITHDGLSYIVSAEAPQFMMTGCTAQSSVPLTLIIENTGGDELARVPVAQSFAYHNVPAAPAALSNSATGESAVGVPQEDGARKSPAESPGHGDSPPQLTVPASLANSPHQGQNSMSTESSSHAYSYPPTTVDAATAAAAAAAAAAQQVQHVQSNYGVASTAYGQDSNSMLGAYRSASFSEGYRHTGPPPPLRAPVWNGYSSSMSHQGHHGHQGHPGHPGHHPHDRYGSITRSDSITHAHSTSSITRPSLPGTLPAPGGTTMPQLIRTSTIQSSAPGSAMSASGYGSGHWGGYPAKAVLSIMGNLDVMAQDWTPEEWNNRRRIVLFRKKQSGSHLEATFRAVPINERPPNSICISCIYWAEKQECFVTSVDTINLLEQLVAAPNRFSVEEKNRIRRNLEGFKPVTVSKAKAESEEFFKLIMAFGAPKPRTIEKDVKVFPWKILGQALKKIISKYSASPSSILSPTGGGGGGASSHHMLTPVTMSPSYAGLPPTPGSVSTATDGTSNVGYMTVATGPTPSDSLASPRSLSGTSASWMAYASGGTGRAISPGTSLSKPQSPSAVGLRMSALPTAYDSRGSASVAHGMPAASQAYGLQHHPTHTFNSPLPVTTTGSVSTSTPSTASVGHGMSHGGGRWENYDVSGNSGGVYSGGQQQGHHAQLYAGGYGDGGQRA